MESFLNVGVKKVKLNIKTISGFSKRKKKTFKNT